MKAAVYLALGAGLIALVWGVIGLQSIFDRERDEARAALAAKETALADYAVRDLERRLGLALEQARPRILEASRDPLAPASGLFLRRGERVLLPRRAVPRSSGETPARALYARLVDPAGPLPESAGDEAWSMRLTLLRSIQQGIGEQGEVEAPFRSLLTHRARYRISTERDLPFQTALLDFFVAEGSPDRGLLHRLVREGVTASDGTHLPGLQRQLLSRVERFSQADIRFLTERIVALSEAAGAPHDDFLLRLHELDLCVAEPCERITGAAERAPAPPPGELVVEAGAPVLAGGGWLLSPRSDGIEGVWVDLDSLVEEAAKAMLEEALLESEDRLELAMSGPASMERALAGVRVVAPRFERAEKELRARYRIKTALGALLAASTIGIVALVGLLVVRERRFLSLRSEFVAAVSHELRTPLASVRLLAETLVRRLDGTPEARDYPARIVREADRLAMMVENILSFNRLEGGPRARITELDPAEIADSLREDLAPYLRGELELDLEGLAGLGLRADPELFRLLLQNLLANACRYNERDPVRIAVLAKPRRSSVVILVSDNGIGIPPEERKRVFTEFYRREPGGRRSRGFGLGLAICRRIMALHGGSIRIAESGPEGTRFELEFPTES